jgi:bifunctional non-homologous end joining protein LigD
MPSAARRLHPAGFVAPMLATLSKTPPDGPQWAHEVKHDGFRFICRRDGDRARVFSRNALDWTDKVPAIVEAMRALPATSATIDGEAAVCDAQGVTDFDALRSALARRGGSVKSSSLSIIISARPSDADAHLIVDSLKNNRAIQLRRP